MKKNTIVINAIKAGRTINLMLNGKLRKKVCESDAVANDFYKTIMRVKANPTEQGVNEVLGYLNEKTRIAMKCGLQTDPETGNVYMAGFNTPVPKTLVEVVEDYHENGYPMDAILNFWKLLMLNPDVRVRESLFEFIKTHDFVLTDSGYMVVYKAVDRVESKKVDNALADYIREAYNHVEVDWRTKAKRYIVYRDENGELHKTKASTADSWDLETRKIEILGNLGEMYENIDDYTVTEEEPEYPYESKYSGAPKMKIRIGEPVQQERKDCDADPARDCSNGLHCGATQYVASFGSWYSGGKSAVLACFVNPAHVVAVPNYDHSKFRTSEYYPFAEVKYENGEIEIIDQAYFESDYSHYEKEELEKMVAKIQADEKPIAMAKNADDEDRPLSELTKIIENRLVVLAE